MLRRVSPPLSARVLSLAILVMVCGPATARDFSLEVADADPLGISAFIPGISRIPGMAADAGVEGGIKGDFAWGLGMETICDSNFNLEESSEDSEVTVDIIPWLAYLSDPEGGALWSFAANYRPIYHLYMDNGDLNGLDHSADMNLSFSGARTSFSVFTRYHDFSGNDRLAGSFVSGWVFTGGAHATRQVAPRTMLHGGLTCAISGFDGPNEGTSVTTATIGGLWDKSERLSLGPGLRYTRTESDISGNRDAWALLAEARYMAGERIWLSASLGPEITNDSGDGGGTGVRADLRARYLINGQWNWNSSLSTASVPSPGTSGYMVNNLNLSTELERQLRKTAVRGGVEFNQSDYESVGDRLIERDHETNLSLFLGCGRNLFSERVAFDSSVRYRTNHGDSDWSQWLVSMSLNMRF
jgi:hypothetical protein